MSAADFVSIAFKMYPVLNISKTQNIVIANTTGPPNSPRSYAFHKVKTEVITVIANIIKMNTISRIVFSAIFYFPFYYLLFLY